MKNKILLICILLLSIVLIIEVSLKKETSFSFEENQNESVKPEKTIPKIKVYDEKKEEIKTLFLEEYIIGVVAAEMPVSFENEALKAQAVAARTYAMYKIENQNLEYDVRIGVSDQAYNTIEEMKDKWQDKFSENYEKVKSAVEKTKGEIMTYHGMTIESFYFSMSNGYTENCEAVFQETLPYLMGVESQWDNETLENYEVTKIYSKEEFCQKLNIPCQNIQVSQINRSPSNRVLTITINDKTWKGTEIRTLLRLRSTDFDIKIDTNIEITTRGYGHGVGMSQYGANGMAKEGKDYKEILNHYYQNIEFSTI